MKRKHNTTPMTLRGLRVARGWTQAQLADLLGTRQSHISEWETGARAPSMPKVYVLAALLGVSVDELCRVVFGAQK